MERRSRELIEHAPDGILQVDESGKILLANRTAETLFGYASDELVGESVDALVPLAVRGHHAGHRESLMRAGKSRPMGLGLNLSARRKDGSEFPVEISLSPVRTGGEMRVTAVIRDITERKRIEEQVRVLQESYMAELQARQQEAERLNRAKSEFMAGVTHELRTPLHTIIGFADLLKEELEGPLNATQQKFVGHIRKDSEHLLELINDLLDLSRIEAGGLQIHNESVSLQRAIAEAVGSIQQHAEAKSIVLSIEPAEDAIVIADPMRLRQILYNLLSNAVKFTPPHGSVRMQTAKEGEMVRVDVIDSGIGIPAEEQEKIFDRFYQVGYTTGGAGLGLAICKQLIAMQGGKISVRSKPGEGSCFSFTLRGCTV